MAHKECLLIDGSLGEGGGAVLRLSTAFSVIFNKPIRIIKIRANRPRPGLRLQHLIGLKILSRLTGSTLSNVQIGTRELTFDPSRNLKTDLEETITTAASLGLILQPIQIASLSFKELEQIKLILIGGGTFGKWAPSLEYLIKVTFPIFKKVGHDLKVNILEYGWYPKGGAKTECFINPPKNDLIPFNFTEVGDIDKIYGNITITNDLHSKRSNITERVKQSVENYFSNLNTGEIDISYNVVKSLSPGVSLLLWTHANNGAIISSGTVLGERKISAEKLGAIAARKLSNYLLSNIPVDNYLSDQLIPLMAYIDKACEIKVKEITNHTRTNIELAKLFTHKSYIIEKKDRGFLIRTKE